MESKKYQVFISSTYTDLKEEREGIIKAILEMYHIPIGMEMFSAEDEDQWEIIRRTIDVSDYYVLILGLRYGSKTLDGISFTQKEYEYALAKKIPILAFIADESISLSKDRRDDDLNEINEFRKSVLANSKMSQPWETKEQLVTKVSISLMKQIMQKPGVGWVRGDEVDSSENLSKELAATSKENRKLREQVRELESKFESEMPDLVVTVPFLSVGEECFIYEKVEMPEKLDLNDVESHLLKYVTEKGIQEYNSEIPSQDELDEFNKQNKRAFLIQNCSRPLIIKISNNGNVKANNVYVDLIFSSKLYVFEKHKKHDFPKNPVPFDLIGNARTMYENKLVINNELQSVLKFNGQLFQEKNVTEFNVPIANANNWTNLDKNKLTVKTSSLLHTRSKTFDDEYMIVPFEKGHHTIEIQVICEEYKELKTQFIELNV